MSFINELTSNTATSVISSSAVSNPNTSNTTSNDFGSVMLQALKNCNGKRPEHVCSCATSNVEENAENSNEVSSTTASLIDNIDEVNESEATEEEKLTAGSCFTMFIKISARISSEVGDAFSGRFKDTTLAFADALKLDKNHNENLLKAYMQKTNEVISSQTEELKSFIGSYLDNMLSAVNSSVSGLNSTLLSSTNLLGNSLSSYSNLLSNSSLLSSSNLLGSTNSLASTLLSGLSSSMNNYSNSSSLAGYAAIDVANAQLSAALSGKSNYTYGIGTSLNTDRYAGRSLTMIRSSEVETTAKGTLRMVDTKGNATTGVAPTGIEIGDSSSQTLATASSKSSESSENSGIAIASSEKDEASDVEIKLVSNTQAKKSYSDALLRKNHIVDLFKQMILSSLSNDDNKDSDIANNANKIKSIDADIKVSFA